MTVIIRPMIQADKPQVMQILHATSEFKPVEVVVAGDLIDAYLDEGTVSGYYLLIAEEDSSVLGYICYGETCLTEGVWDVYWIAVSRGMQGKGIGRALMAAAEDAINKSHARLILIETSSTVEYDKTRRFYHGIGYTIVCRIPDFYVPGDDKVVFQKRLT